MSQYKIPQKTQREDKIFGPLTARQMLYAFLTIITSYLIYSTINLNPIIWFSPIERLLWVVPLLLAGLAFTFIEINERPFEIYFAAFMHFLFTPKVRIWQKVVVLDPLGVGELSPQDKEEQPQVVANQSAEAAAVSRADLRRLSQMIDRPETIEQPPEAPRSSRANALLSAVEASAKQVVAPTQVLARQKQKKSLVQLPNLMDPIQNFFFGSGKSSAKPKTVVAPDNNSSPPPPTVSTTPSAGPEPTPGTNESQPAAPLPKVTNPNATEESATPVVAEAPKKEEPKFDIQMPDELSIEDLIKQVQNKPKDES